MARLYIDTFQLELKVTELLQRIVDEDLTDQEIAQLQKKIETIKTLIEDN